MQRNRILIQFLLRFLLVTCTFSASAADLIPLGSSWKYWLGTQEASAPTNAWRFTGFNDSAWASGTAPIGYDTGGTPGTAPIVTLLPDPRTAGNPAWTSTYFRKSFTVANPATVSQLIFTLYVDDGAVIWLNGTEIGRINVPDGELAYNSAASVADETRVLTTTNIASLLVPGANLLAVHAFNGSAPSSDFVFEGILSATLDEAPTVASIDPLPSSIVTSLSSINVVFSEGVSGVNASDLLINGIPAANVTPVSSREYVFSFPQPSTGSVSVAWASNPGIADVDGSPDLFIPGPAWSYNLDTNAIPAGAVISEFLTDNTAGIRDEDGNRSDWIEIYNPGPTDLSLTGWFLTDDPLALAKWRFPSVNLGPNKYLLVWASAKNRTNSFAPLHTSFKLSKAAGSYLALVNPQTNVASAFVSYPVQTSDVSFGRDRIDPNLVGYFTVPTPGAQNSISGSGFAPSPVFSLESGIYTNDVLTLTITAAPGTTVRYTYNGSEPTNSSPVYTGPISFNTNMIIKARAFSTNQSLWPSPVLARTFVMLDNSTADFNSNLPLIIISTDGVPIPLNLASGATRPRGAFVALDTVRGRSSLRGKTDFQGLAQFEITGQTSSGADFLKKPHRVEINDELGNDLKVPLLGMPAESDWILRNPWSDKCLMNDFLGYELWENMGHYSCRRRLVEVFVDTGGGKLTYPGDYYGVMVLFERIEVGKNRVDVDELTPSMTNEPAISGGYIIKKDKDSAGDLAFNTTGGAGHPGQTLKFHEPKPHDITVAQQNWIRNYLNLFEASIYSPNWTNATGTNHYSYYIDVDSFVDQHLHVEFTKQIDGYRLSSYYTKPRNGKLRPEPVWDWNLSFGNANYCEGGKTNGWYWNRQPATDGFSVGPVDHIWLRRLIYGLPNITTAAPWTESNGPGDGDFRQKITDRWAVLRTNVLNGDRIVARIDEVANLLNEAAARNYAKYPNLLNNYQWPNPEGPPWDVDYTQPTYGAIISEMKKFVNGRFIWMDSQFLAGPTLSKEGGPISPGATLSISAPAGSIYYTLDGTDPRLPGGGISPTASLYTGPVTLNANARVVARSYVFPTTLWTPWSAPASATFVVQTPRLIITEIMYHPAPLVGSTNVDEDFEYIELKNVGPGPLNLLGYTISGGIDFTFPNLSLPAGQRILAVKNQAAFTARYGAGLNIAGEYSGNLANTGNRLILQGRLREPILDFSYDDAWYPVTDGLGFSLVVVNENAASAAWGTSAQWRPSSVVYGSPGQGDSAAPGIPRVLINEALSHSDTPPPTDTIELYNPGNTPANVGDWYLSDDFRSPKKYRITAGTTIAPNGYLTLDEGSFNVAGANNIPFALGSQGDQVYLFSGDADGNLTGYFHGFSFGAAKNGVSFGRYVISTGEERFVLQSSTTLGAINSGPVVGPVVISEIMFHPVDVFTNGAFWNDSEDEFIELQNITAAPVSLFDSVYPTNSWKLDNAVTFAFPSNTTLAAGGYLLVVNFNPATEPAQLASFRAKYGVSPTVPIFGPYSGSLDNASAKVSLYQPDTPALDGGVPYVLVDQVQYVDHEPWPVTGDGYGHSIHRLQPAAFGDDPANWTAGNPSPGAGYVGGPAPVITSNPLNQTAPATAQATFSGAASGPGPLRYQWRFNGSLLSGATNNVLVLSNLHPSQAGQYQLVALNNSGSAVSAPATLTVLTPAHISQHPISQVVTNGSNVVFTVSASSLNPPLSIQWLHNGQPIPSATDSVLALNNVQEERDSGIYTAAITDGSGTILSSPATLTILLKPSVVQPLQPLRLSVLTGQNVTLGIQTVGTKPMFYRWRRVLTNGASLIVANRTLNTNVDFFTITNVTANLHGASYSVILTNAAYGLPNLVFTNCILSVLPDSNGNGIPDQWETDFFGSSTGAARDADPDGDGMSNWAEYIAGTDPTNAASYLKVDSIIPGTGAGLHFQAVSNHTYTVLYKDGLSVPVWSRLSDVLARGTNWEAVVQDPSPATNRFYRLATPRQD